jgi:hypothetical protein
MPLCVEDPRIIDEDVEPREFALACVNGGAPITRTRHIQMEWQGNPRARAAIDLVGEFARFGVEHIANNHPRSFVDEQLRFGSALAAGTTGNQSDFSFQTIHPCHPPRS